MGKLKSQHYYSLVQFEHCKSLLKEKKVIEKFSTNLIPDMFQNRNTRNIKIQSNMTA